MREEGKEREEERGKREWGKGKRELEGRER